MFITVDKTNEEITADILQELPSEYQKSVGFISWDYARAIAIGALEKIYEKLKYICSLGDINNFEYDDLVKFVKQRRGIIAHEEQKATGVLTATGNGTIKVGDLFQTESGLQFQATEEKTIVGTGTFTVECVTAGIIGNVPPNSIAVIPVSIAGISTVTNLNAMSGGYDKETKESIIERYLEDIQQPITSNNINHYKKWAKEVTGVGDAKIKPTWNGNNTVKVVIINANKEVADNALINDVQKYIDPFGYKVSNGTITGYVQNYNENGVQAGEKIYSDYDLQTVIKTAEAEEFSYTSAIKYGWGYGNGQASVGAYTTVESAKAKNLAIAVAVDIKSGYDKETVTTNIQNKINEYLKSTVFTDTYISYAKIGSCVIDSEGVADYKNLTINEGTANIQLSDTDLIVEIAVLNELSVTEIED